MDETRGADEKQAELPIQRVVMFSSGVSFFEHAGEVSGNAKVDMRFHVRDVNDLLKSMVLQDLGGGRISTVSYGSKDPITRTLQTFAVNLTENPTLADLLEQVRGEGVEVEAPAKISGIIVGIESREQHVKDSVITTSHMTLLTDDGIRSLPLENVGRIKLVNAKLDADFRQALAVLATSRDVDKKTVSLNFLGDGKRKVRVGYVQESPVWKTSYRLVLDEKEAPLLQGWAIVENTTESDWTDVNLALVSGRPISFKMDLYEPLYVSRPVVAPELYASLRPRTYEQDLAKSDPAIHEDRGVGGMALGGSGGPMAAPRKSSKMAPAAAADASNRSPAFLRSQNREEEKLELAESFQSVAQAGDVGEMFQYNIATPVSVQRGRSAMLPIVNESAGGKRVSIYNEAVHGKHPLHGLRFKNTTALHLMQGPITVFEDGAYAGDAQIQALPPGSERLISYAMDLNTEVASTTTGVPQQLVSCRLTKGVMYVSHKLTRSKTYTVKNSSKKSRDVLIEYPLQQPWVLVEPNGALEKTRDMYRFLVVAEPGKPASLTVKEEHVQSQQVAVSNLGDDMIGYYLSQQVVSGEVKAALQDVVKKKSEIAQGVAKRAEAERQIGVIDQEQNRIRQNMGQLPKDSDLYRRYVTKFSDQETANDKLRESVTALAAQEAKLRQQLEAYLLGLDLK